MIEFLTLEDVLLVHQIQIDRFGGTRGVRDEALLESALAQPKAMFGNKYLHKDIFAMAAAYLFHIVKNHPMLDGNKRTGLASILLFLRLNGVYLQLDNVSVTKLTISVAKGDMEKVDIATCLKELSIS